MHLCAQCPSETDCTSAAWTVGRAALDAPCRFVAPAIGLWDKGVCEVIRIRVDLRGIEVATPGAREDRVILFFHGGAHCLFSVWTHREFIGRLSAATQARVVAVNYRKAPQNPFPAAIEDALSGWRWTREHHPSASVAVLGDSAGGNLAFALLVKLAQLEEPQPVACVGFSPWLLLDPDALGKRKELNRKPSASLVLKVRGEQSSNHAEQEHNGNDVEAAVAEAQLVSPRTANCQPRARSEVARRLAVKCREHLRARWDAGARRCAARYAGSHTASNPLISPLLADVALARRFPPVLIHASEDEPLRVDAEDMISLCREAEVSAELKLYRGFKHVLQAIPFAKDSVDSFSRVGEFLQRHWRR